MCYKEEKKKREPSKSHAFEYRTALNDISRKTYTYLLSLQPPQGDLGEFICS